MARRPLLDCGTADALASVVIPRAGGYPVRRSISADHCCSGVLDRPPPRAM